MAPSEVTIKFINKSAIRTILPLLSKLDPHIKLSVLEKRLLAMVEENYKCVGIYSDSNLIGICGLWEMTRHYCGKSLEPDHVIIDESHRSKGIGNMLFEWLFNYARENNFEATELNSYVRNTASHKFYYNLGYEIKGFHFVKILD